MAMIPAETLMMVENEHRERLMAANDANSPVPFSRLCDARIVQVANASGDLHGAAFPMICVQSDIAHSFLPLPRRSHDHCGGR